MCSLMQNVFSYVECVLSGRSKEEWRRRRQRWTTPSNTTPSSFCAASAPSSNTSQCLKQNLNPKPKPQTQTSNLNPKPKPRHHSAPCLHHQATECVLLCRMCSLMQNVFSYVCTIKQHQSVPKTLALVECVLLCRMCSRMQNVFSYVECVLLCPHHQATPVTIQNENSKFLLPTDERRDHCLVCIYLVQNNFYTINLCSLQTKEEISVWFVSIQYKIISMNICKFVCERDIHTFGCVCI